MSESIGEIGLDLVINHNQFESQMNGITKIAKKAGATLAAAFGVKKLIDFGKGCLELGSDLVEVQNVVDVTFPSMKRRVDEFAQSAITTFGLSETMAKRYTGTFGAMAKAFGFTEQQAYTMSTTLTGLAGDVASFYNISQDEAYTKLKSVFTGETESLKDLGVVMTQTALDSYAMANGFGKTTSAMSEAEKVALRYQFVMTQLSTASGDFARTSGGWANQVRVLTLQFDSLKATIGQGLINLLTPVLKVINTIIGRLMMLANAFKAFTELITGNKNSSSSMSSLGVAAGEASVGLENASNAADNATNSATNAGKAAKKAASEMKALMGFDKINKSSENTSSDTDTSIGDGAGSIGAGGVDFGNLSTGETVVEKLDKKFESLFENMKKNLEPLSIQLKRFAEISKDAFSWLLENVLQPLAKFTINEALPRFFETLANILKIVNNVLLALQPLWQWFWDNVLKPIAKWTAGAFLTAWDAINEVLSAFGDWCGKHPKIIEGAAVAIAAFFAAWKVTELLAFIQTSGGVISAVKGIVAAIKAGIVAKLLDKAETIAITALYAKDFVLSLVKGTAQLVEQTAQFAVNTAAKFANAVAQGVMTAATAAWNAVCTVATALTTALGAAISFLTSPIGLVIVAIGALIAIGVLLYKNWDVIMEKAAELKEWLVEKTRAMYESVTGFFNDMKEKIDYHVGEIRDWLIEKWEAIKEKTLNVWKTITTSVTDTVNTMKEKINYRVGEIRDKLSEKWKAIKEKTIEVWEAITTSVTVTVNTMKDKASQTIETLKTNVSEKWEDIKSTFKGIISFLKDIFTGDWESAWNTVTETFKSIFNKIVGYAKDPINGIIGLVNSLIDKINTVITQINKKLSFEIGFDMPGWLGGGSYKYRHTTNIPSINTIPFLANGGFVEKNTPRLAVIGDNRHQGEIVSPEDKLQEMVNKAARAAGGGVSKEELESIVNRAVMRIVAALANMGFYLDSTQITKAIQEAKAAMDIRGNSVEVG